MKTSLIKLKSNCFLLLILAFPVWSKPVAQVTHITGQVFAVSPDGKTNSIKLNDHIEEKFEVMVVEGGAITLNDYYDSSYSLMSGSHIKLFDKSIVLKSGKVWTKSSGKKFALALTTANGHVDFTKSEFISTFDQERSRSQFLVINGEVEVSNVLEKNMKYNVPAGTFTIVDPEIENGIPRAPTKVGMASMTSAIAEFKLSNVSPVPKVSSRTIASVEEAPAVPESKGEIIYIKSFVKSRRPSSLDEGAHEFYKTKLKNKTIHQGFAPIRIYGVKKTTHTRAPASLKISPPSIPRAKSIHPSSVDNEFMNSLREQSDKQPKYSKELQSIIKNLESY